MFINKRGDREKWYFGNFGICFGLGTYWHWESSKTLEYSENIIVIFIFRGMILRLFFILL